MAQQKKTQEIAVIVSTILIITSLGILFLSTSQPPKKTEEVKGMTTFEIDPTLTITPELNISRFASYLISSDDVPGTPTSVSIEMLGEEWW